MFQTHTPSHAHPDPTRLVRFLAIAIVFAMGAAFAVPTPVAAQVGASFSGSVLDLDGAPIADAEVTVKKRVNGSLWSYHETLTDKEGGFSFQGLEPGTWELTARLDGYRTNRTSLDLTVGENDRREIQLVSLTERIYSGTLLSGEDGSPIADAIITVRGYGGEEKDERSTTSAEDGTFRVRLFAHENQVTITRSGFGTHHDWFYQPSGIIERTIHLHPVPPQSATVTGKVVDADGNPVQAYISLSPVYDDTCCYAYPESDDGTEPAMAPAPDRAYSSYYYHNHNSTTTGTDGTFTMKAYPGEVTVQANRQGYLVAQQRITLQEDGTETLTLTLGKLPERTVTISGTVKDAETGKPIQGASVNVQVPAAGDHAWASTDADGKYTMTVRPGYTILEVNHWGHCCIAYDTMVVSSDDGDGRESSMIAPEPYPQDGKQYHPKSVVFTTAAGDKKTLDVDLPAKPEPETTVVGYVLDGATGKAVANAHVSLQNHATGDWGEARTDKNGSYKFLAHGGYHSVRIWVEGYLPYSTNLVLPSSGSERADFEVTAGDEVQEGWWSPDGHDGEDYPEPRPMPASSGKAVSEDAAYGGSDDTASMAADGDSRSAESPSGPQAYTGSAGGLPAYDASKKDDTFGAGDSRESPVSPLITLVFALGALAVVAGLRRQR